MTKGALWTRRVFHLIFILATLLVAIDVLSQFPGWVKEATRLSRIDALGTDFAVEFLNQARGEAAIVAGLVVWLAAVALKRTFASEPEVER